MRGPAAVSTRTKAGTRCAAAARSCPDRASSPAGPCSRSIRSQSNPAIAHASATSAEPNPRNVPRSGTFVWSRRRKDSPTPICQVSGWRCGSATRPPSSEPRKGKWAVGHRTCPVLTSRSTSPPAYCRAHQRLGGPADRQPRGEHTIRGIRRLVTGRTTVVVECTTLSAAVTRTRTGRPGSSVCTTMGGCRCTRPKSARRCWRSPYRPPLIGSSRTNFPPTRGTS